MAYFSEKIRAVFHARIVETVLNQNRDLEAIKKCFFMILQKLDAVTKSEKQAFLRFFEKEWRDEQR